MLKGATFLLTLLLISAQTVTAQVDMTSAGDRVSIVSSSDAAITLSFELEGLEQVEAGEDQPDQSYRLIPGEGATYIYGKPQLPAVTRMVVVPHDAGLELIVRNDEPRFVSAENGPALCLDEELNQEQDIRWNRMGGIFPHTVAEMSEPIVIRGVRLVNITTYPIRYNYAENGYLHYENIETEIRFTDDEPVNPATHPIRRNRSQYFLKFIEGMAINADQVGRDDPRDEEPPYVAHYCIVTNENNLNFDSFGEFIEWRRRAGYKVDVISIPNNRAGDNYADDIKERIQDLYDSYLDDGEDPFDLLMLAGDRSTYNNCGSGGVGAPLGAPRGNNIWSNGIPHHYDWFHGLLEGDDLFADVGVSRWAAGNRNMHDLWWGRTKAYEVEPNMDDDEWFTKGAVYAQRWAGNYHNSLATNVRWGKSVLEAKGFQDIRLIEDMVNANVNQIGAFLVEQFDEGVNVMLGRAENYYFRSGFTSRGVDRDQEIGVFPIDLNIAGHHEWTTWWMLRDGTGNNLNGPVIATTGHGGQVTLAYNICWVEEVNGFMLRDLPLGWARVQSLTAPELYIPGWRTRFRGRWNQDNACFTDVDYYGDPGIQYWQGVPQMVNADFPDEITPDTRMIEVYVFDADEETDVAGATVTLYAPGDIPDFDDDDYPDYDDMQMWTTTSDSDGIALFVFDDGVEFDPDTQVQLTVTGRNIRPLLEEIDIDSPLNDIVIEVAEYTLTEVEGNEDDDMNPGELFELDLTAVNLSRRNEALEVTARVRSDSPYIEIQEHDDLEFGDIDSEETSDDADPIRFRLSEDCPDGASRPITRPTVIVDFASGEDVWQTAVKLTPIAPHFIIETIVGGSMIPTDENEVELDIDIRNAGGMDATGVTAELYSLGLGIVVLANRADYDDIDAGNHRRIVGDEFNVSGNQLAIPGSTTEMMIVFSSNDDFTDTTFFQLVVGEPERNKPQGPDGYGYICFDDTDTDWEIAPEYEWIEISRDVRDRDFNGTRCDFDGNSPSNIGETQVINLPFEFQFYGQIYEELTIATNGFVSVGDQEYVTNFQNWPLDRAVGGLGMIAPFWDNLRLSGDADVYYYYDNNEEGISKFIIEWYQLRARTGGNSDLNFEVIIYDMPTESGDHTIQFQYKDIEDRSSGDWTNTVPRASVGISSPEGTTGINYVYNNDYPVTSAELEDHRAILFATSPKYRSGVLHGWVYDERTEEPIEDVLVVTEYGQAARTDNEGYYIINNALADVVFYVTAMKFGYNDSTELDNNIAEDDTLVMNFDLLHPELRTSEERLHAFLEPDFETELSFDLTNRGNGPVDWRLRKRLPGNADVDPWEHRESFFVGDTVDNPRVKGVVWTGENFICTGGGGSARDDNFIFVLNSVGNLIDQFPQFGDSRYGMGDLAWDGGSLWGGEDETIFSFTAEGDLNSSFEGPFNPNQAIAWDPDRQLLWISAKTSQYIAGYNREGREVAQLPRFSFTVYGLSYFPDDPDGYPLYVHHNYHVRDVPDRTLVHKINPDTEDTLFVAELSHELGGKPEGAFITNQYDVYSWVFIAISNSSDHGDRIDLWQIDSRRDWYKMFNADDPVDDRDELFSGRMEAGETHEYSLLLNSAELPRVLFEGQLLFSHNAMQATDTMRVFLDVIGNIPPLPFGLLTPADSSMLNGNLEPEVLFSWEESIDPNWGDQVVYQLWIQSDADSTLAGTVDSTSISVDIESLRLELLPELEWWVVANSDPDLVPSEQRFTFNYIPDDVSNSSVVPVQFGLESVYPSPFNSSTSISYGMDRVEGVTLRVYDLAGREVIKLVDRVANVGHHRVIWDASLLSSGVYILRLESAGRTNSAKIALIK